MQPWWRPAPWSLFLGVQEGREREVQEGFLEEEWRGGPRALQAEGNLEESRGEKAAPRGRKQQDPCSWMPQLGSVGRKFEKTQPTQARGKASFLVSELVLPESLWESWTPVSSQLPPGEPAFKEDSCVNHCISASQKEHLDEMRRAGQRSPAAGAFLQLVQAPSADGASLTPDLWIPEVLLCCPRPSSRQGRPVSRTGAATRFAQLYPLTGTSHLLISSSCAVGGLDTWEDHYKKKVNLQSAIWNC